MVDPRFFMHMGIETKGVGWRTGREASVRFFPSVLPEVRIECAGAATVPTAAAYQGGDRASRLVVGRTAILGVEHLFAALSGLGIHRGVTIRIEGDEVPLLDGCASAFVSALLALPAPPVEVRSVITRRAEIVLGESVYMFEPGDDRAISVELSGFPEHVLREASWDATREAFGAIAGARTFVREDELEALLARGVTAYVDPSSVFVVRDDALEGTSPVSPSEPARHKLLDLIGDLYAFGGVPKGSLRATRPGHARNVEAMRRATQEGIVATLARHAEARAGAGPQAELSREESRP